MWFHTARPSFFAADTVAESISKDRKSMKGIVRDSAYNDCYETVFFLEPHLFI